MSTKGQWTDDRRICERCGLPIGRGSEEGPMWTPEIKGVEVCGCPPLETQERQRAAAIHHDLEELQHELDEIQKHQH